MSQESVNHSAAKDLQSNDRVALLERQLASSIRRCRPARLLLMARSEQRPALPDLATGSCIELSLDSRSPVLNCRMDELPFCDGTFDVVIVSDLFRFGHERTLGEAQRVVKPGGSLLVCGRGRLDRTSGSPLLDVGSVCRHLRHSGFDIRACQLIGLLGRNTVSEKAWLRPLASWSHSVLLRARHHEDTPSVTTIRFRSPRGSAVRTALDSVSREAV